MDKSSILITKIEQPMAINVQKSNKSNARRLFINIQAFGKVITDIPLLIDTGSSGISIDMRYLLPKEMYDETGVIMNGKSSIEYNGITFTDEKESIHYGGGGVKTTQYGQIAYAQITIGDENGKVTTGKVPFFCYYKIEKNGKPVDIGFNPGIFGVNPKAVQFNGKMKPIFNFLEYEEGINAGFLLKEVGSDWSNCSYEKNECPKEPLFIIGITDEMKKGFTEEKLEAIKIPEVYKSAIKASISDGEKTEIIHVMFDTGNSSFGEIVPKINTQVPLMLTIGDTFQWDFSVPKPYQSTFSGHQNPIGRSVIGIDFFENHALFYDFTKGTLGVK